jgi:uncharacterized peroxidase-related enzyme
VRVFLPEPPHSAAVDALYDEDRESDGYVGNNTRLWCYRPDVLQGFVQLRSSVTRESTLSDRDVAVLVAATASVRSDSYCALAWGTRLAQLAGDDAAAAVVKGGSAKALSDRENALASWARAVGSDPNGTTRADVAALRGSGLTDQEIFDATVFVALRMAFSTVDNALGAEPDLQLAANTPSAVRDAVSFGRAPAASASI